MTDKIAGRNHIAVRTRLSRLVPIAGAAMAALILSSCGSAPAAKNDDSVIRARALELGAAWKKKDAAAILAILDDNITVMAPGTPVMQGKRNTAAYVEHVVKDPSFHNLMEVDAVGQSGDLGYSRGRFDLQYTEKPGTAPTRIKGTFVSILRKDDKGRWLVIEDISTPQG